ncbi:hypothetical protein MHH33_14105 [Paenisporosarcina sp. FSL H8-0542]|uniref:hypothetical protein n=1 Tax=unclassified Paenisporosarcina TaxID=2642018 RepID=UPI00034E285C|nr:hypothetical protein [Paenisporosarcina sp. HGH0030]EPD52291.1 hypothetical protein HMPREF1210_01644 [Paenisporosarcina sp. HGH0030]
MVNIFVVVWVVITSPILLSVVFRIFKPIVNADSTGISMIIIVLLVGVLDAYIGVKLIEKKIQPWLEKRKR